MSVVKIDSGINSVADSIKFAIDALKESGDAFSSAETKLGDTSKWAGSAHDKCTEAHEAAERYRIMITPVCEQLQGLLTKLETDAVNFRA